MVEDLIKRLRDDAGLDGQKLLAADLLEQQAARIAELTTCKLCNSTGNSTPCAYPTEINRQQARRLTALESERDALLAAAGKEAVPFAWFQQVDDYVEFVSWLKIDQTDPPIFPLYTAPTAALEKGDGRDAWISVDERLPDEGQNVAFVVSGASLPFDHLNGKVLGGYFAHVARHPTFSVPGLGLRASHWQPLPAPPAALSQKAGEQK